MFHERDETLQRELQSLGDPTALPGSLRSRRLDRTGGDPSELGDDKGGRSDVAEVGEGRGIRHVPCNVGEGIGLARFADCPCHLFQLDQIRTAEQLVSLLDAAVAAQQLRRRIPRSKGASFPKLVSHLARPGRPFQEAPSSGVDAPVGECLRRHFHPAARAGGHRRGPGKAGERPHRSPCEKLERNHPLTVTLLSTSERGSASHRAPSTPRRPEIACATG